MFATSFELRYDFLFLDLVDFEFEQFGEVALYKNEVM